MTTGGSAIAHTRADGGTHDLREHLDATGRRAQDFAGRFGAGELAHVAGCWHDLGKYSPAFQAKLQGALTSQLNDEDIEAQEAASQRVDHSTAGALHAATHGPFGDVLAAVIAGHHAGLADRAALKERLHRKSWLLAEALHGAPPGELLGLAKPSVPTPLVGSHTDDEGRRRREFFTRMVFSALCDADFLDTEGFMDAGRAAHRPTGPSLSDLAAALRAHLDDKERAAPETTVNRCRAEVRRHCANAASQRPGRFSLTVPTGGGKTLAALTFALEHALAHGLDRVIVAVPYTAILEQNADVYRSVFARFGDDALIEHHTALAAPHDTFRNKLAAENWDARLVVTTTVQLFESLFARRPSACRKLHNLARAVIVLDEAQTLPPALLPTILDGITELTERYGSTVLSCTATQPALGKTPHLPCGLTEVREIIPDTDALFAKLRRVEVRTTPKSTPAVSWGSLADMLAGLPDVLAIVHRRDDARALCDALDARLSDTSSVHLSALQCPAHRSELVADLKARKRAGSPVRVVATQLVEAGVDLDFAVVYRAMAGFDALAQAAGRCNREGALALGIVHTFNAPTEPPPGVLRDGLAVARAMLDWTPGVDVLSPDAQRRFFERFYKQVQAASDTRAVQAARKGLDFELTAKRFKMIDDDWSAPVVIPWGDGARWIERARTQAAGDGVERWMHRKLQRYTVTVPRRLHDSLVAVGTLERVGDTLTVLPTHHADKYTGRYGLRLDALAEGRADIAALIVG